MITAGGSPVPGLVQGTILAGQPAARRCGTAASRRATFLRAKSWGIGLCVLVLLLSRVPRAVAGLTRSVRAIRLANIERALALPLAERIRLELVRSPLPSLPEDAGWTLYRLASATEPDSLVYFHARPSEVDYHLGQDLAALLYPRVLVVVSDPGPDWTPCIATDLPDYVLAPARGQPAPWEEHAVLLLERDASALWRLVEDDP